MVEFDLTRKYGKVGDNLHGGQENPLNRRLGACHFGIYLGFDLTRKSVGVCRVSVIFLYGLAFGKLEVSHKAIIAK